MITPPTNCPDGTENHALSPAAAVPDRPRQTWSHALSPAAFGPRQPSAAKFADVKTETQRKELTDMWKTRHCHYIRVRAHAVLLSGQGYKISHLVDIFGVERDLVSSWIDRFHEGGVKALEDDEHTGAPRMLDDKEQELLKQLFKKHPTRPGKILIELEKETGKQMSK